MTEKDLNRLKVAILVTDGAQWVDRELVVNGNLLTSRKPDDIPAFSREMARLFAEAPVGAHTA
jgi:putative intracellular protease/amidase